MSRDALGAAALVIILGWIALSWFFGDRWGDTIGSIAIGALLFVALVTGIWRLAKERPDGR